MVSPDQEEFKRCASCGMAGVELSTAGDINLCEECQQKEISGEGLWLSSLPDHEEPPAEERFHEVFKAARVLHKERITTENQIIPTLALAEKIDQDIPNLIEAKERLVIAAENHATWEREADRFSQEFKGLRPVQVVDRVLILEQLPAYVEIVKYSGTEVPKEVRVEVYQRPRPATPEYIAELYEEALLANSIPYGESSKFSFGSEALNDRLVITIGCGEEWPIEHAEIAWRMCNASYPHPRLVQEQYGLLLGTPSKAGFARGLTGRERGGAPDADNLIPACVAFYLREYGKVHSRKEVHRLLNEHVLRDSWKGPLPEEGYSSPAANQLWRDVNNPKKIEAPLVQVEHTLLLGGY
jgi:hypothetical protein